MQSLEIRTAERRLVAGSAPAIRAVLHTARGVRDVTAQVAWWSQAPQGPWVPGLPSAFEQVGTHRIRAELQRTRAGRTLDIRPLPTSDDVRAPLAFNGRRSHRLVWRDADGRECSLPLVAKGSELVGAMNLDANPNREILLADARQLRAWPLGASRREPTLAHPAPPVGKVLAAARIDSDGAPARLVRDRARWNLENLAGSRLATLQGLASSGRDRIIGLLTMPGRASWHVVVHRRNVARIIELLPLRPGFPPVAIDTQLRPFRKRDGRPVAAGDFNGDSRIDLALRRGSRLRLWADGLQPVSRWHVRHWRVRGAS